MQHILKEIIPYVITTIKIWLGSWLMKYLIKFQCIKVILILSNIIKRNRKVISILILNFL